MSPMDRITESVTLILANLMSIAARNVVAMIANGLTTRDAVKDDERGKKRHSENGKTSQATGQKYRFVSFHNSLSNSFNIAPTG